MKKIISLILILMLSITLVACSNTGSQEETSKNPSTTEESTTEETTTQKLPTNAVEVISAYSNEELGIDIDRDKENFKFALKEEKDDDFEFYRVDAVYINENEDSTITFDTQGIFYVSKDLTKAYIYNENSNELTELPTK